MSNTYGFGARKNKVCGHFVSWCIDASEGFYRGAGLAFQTRPGFGFVGPPFLCEVKSYPIGSCGAGSREAASRID